MGLFKKDNKMKPDLTIKVSLCSQHKDFCSVNKKVIPTKTVPNNVMSASQLREVGSDIRNCKVIKQNGKNYAPFEKRVNQMAVPANKAVPYEHVTIASTQISADASQIRDNFVVSPELVIQNLRLIRECKGCKVELIVA
jgi:hypothetical protein